MSDLVRALREAGNIVSAQLRAEQDRAARRAEELEDARRAIKVRRQAEQLEGVVWRERQQAHRRRQREALLVLHDPMLRMRVELSRQLEQGWDAARGQWVNGARDIGAAKTWIFDPTDVANTLDWEPSRKLTQEVERAWTDRVRLDVVDPAIRAQVEEVRKHGRAVGFLSPDSVSWPPCSGTRWRSSWR